MVDKNRMIKGVAYGAIVGAGLAYIYILTLGKGKNLKLINVLGIGAGAGAVIGAVAGSMRSGDKTITEESLRAKAKSINPDTEAEVDSYLLIINKAKSLTEQDKQRIYKVIDAVLSAKKDGKWDEKADLESKKQILMTYGITDEDFKVFTDVVIKGLSDLIVGAFDNIFKP